MPKQPSLLISGSVAYDRIMDYRGKFADSLLPDQLHQINVSFLVDDLKENFGGTAGNIAYNLALLEERSTIFSTVGKDFAPYKAWMDRHGIDASKIVTEQDKPTGAAYIMTDQGNNQIAAFHLGAMAIPYPPLDTTLSLFASRPPPATENTSNEGGIPLRGDTVGGALVDHGRSTSWVRYAVVSPGNIFDMIAFPRVYREHNIPYLFDPGQNIPALSGEDLRACINGATVLVANDYEMNMIREKTGWSNDDLRAAVDIIVTTLGENGSRIETENETISVPAVPCDVVKDPTGAGDAYRAGFLKGLLKNLPLDQCGKLGSVMAAYTVEQYGTQTHSPTFQEIRERYKENYSTELAFGHPDPERP